MRKIQTITWGAVVLSAAVAAAQTAADPQRREQQRQPESRVQESRGQQTSQTARQPRSEADRMFATCLAIDNWAEIQVAEAASQRLEDTQAKQFAQQLVQDHRAMLEKLQQFGADASGLRTTASARSDASTARGDVTVRTGQAGQTGVDVQVNRETGEARRSDRSDSREITAAGTSPSSHFDFAAIKREIAQECVQSAQRELETSDDPDRCYIGAQVVLHQHMLDTLKVFQRHASPQLADTLAQASETTQKHLDSAKQILKSLDKKVAAGGTARVGATAR
jgi:predicted outer membrane protein